MTSDQPSAAQTAALCPLCGGAQAGEFTVPNGVVIRRCLGCGLLVNAKPELVTAHEDYYEGDYHWSHYGHAARRKQRTAAFLIRQIEACCPARGRLLDVGCSYGHVVAAASQRGWEAHGVDVSADMVTQGRERGLELVQGSLHELPFPDGHFTVVHARHVLEHDLDFFASLAEMRRVLADDGLLVVAVPDASSPKVRRRGPSYASFWVPEHMVFFTRVTLGTALQRAGFTACPTAALAGLWADGPRGVLPFLGWRLAEILPDAVGLGKTLRGVWRKA